MDAPVAAKAQATRNKAPAAAEYLGKHDTPIAAADMRYSKKIITSDTETR
tara:strand:- start:265 stop:414 length:150 start_codon:yes stop_codon:yes gene_type:complete